MRAGCLVACFQAFLFFSTYLDAQLLSHIPYTYVVNWELEVSTAVEKYLAIGRMHAATAQWPLGGARVATADQTVA